MLFPVLKSSTSFQHPTFFFFKRSSFVYKRLQYDASFLLIWHSMFEPGMVSCGFAN